MPLTTADHFRIGSNTKTFVISVLLQLVGEKKLTPRRSAQPLPRGVTIPNAQNITVRELCNMRSGLFEAYDTPQFAQLNWKRPERLRPAHARAVGGSRNPTSPPNKGYHYSNTNYLLLGLIIENIPTIPSVIKFASGCSSRLD